MNRFTPAAIIMVGISIMAAAILLGPIVSPPEFSWLRHSTSEQAGQNLGGAWVMRAGFVSYGLATVFAALMDWHNRPFVRAALILFGIGLIGTAIWSNASIIPDIPSDMHEDWMHSVASGVVGTAFAAACAGRLFGPGGSKRDGLAWVGLAVSVTFPLAMGELPSLRGLIQRMMFAFSFVIVGREFAAFDNDPGTEDRNTV